MRVQAPTRDYSSFHAAGRRRRRVSIHIVAATPPPCVLDAHCYPCIIRHQSHPPHNPPRSNRGAYACRSPACAYLSTPKPVRCAAAATHVARFYALVNSSFNVCAELHATHHPPEHRHPDLPAPCARERARASTTARTLLGAQLCGVCGAVVPPHIEMPYFNIIYAYANL